MPEKKSRPAGNGAASEKPQVGEVNFNSSVAAPRGSNGQRKAPGKTKEGVPDPRVTDALVAAETAKAREADGKVLPTATVTFAGDDRLWRVKQVRKTEDGGRVAHLQEIGVPERTAARVTRSVSDLTVVRAVLTGQERNDVIRPVLDKIDPEGPRPTFERDSKGRWRMKPSHSDAIERAFIRKATHHPGNLGKHHLAAVLSLIEYFFTWGRLEEPRTMRKFDESADLDEKKVGGVLADLALLGFIERMPGGGRTYSRMRIRVPFDWRDYLSENLRVEAGSPDYGDGGSPDYGDGGSPDYGDGGSPDYGDGGSPESDPAESPDYGDRTTGEANMGINVGSDHAGAGHTGSDEGTPSAADAASAVVRAVAVAAQARGWSLTADQCRSLQVQAESAMQDGRSVLEVAAGFGLWLAEKKGNFEQYAHERIASVCAWVDLDLGSTIDEAVAVGFGIPAMRPEPDDLDEEFVQSAAMVDVGAFP